MDGIIVKKFNGFEIRQLSNGYLNITDLCKSNGKHIGHWNENKKTKSFLRAISQNLGRSVNELMCLVYSNYHTGGTWAHPTIAINVAQWISPAFSAKVSEWVDEWSKSSEKNQTTFFSELSNLETSESDQMELKLKLRLKDELKAEVEVETPAGFIDLLTDEYIIEIKDAPKWKHALGQILSYSTYYPKHKKKLILFGQIENIEVAIEICANYEVIVEIIELEQEVPAQISAQKMQEVQGDVVDELNLGHRRVDFVSKETLLKICRSNKWKGYCKLNKQDLEKFVSERLKSH